VLDFNQKSRHCHHLHVPCPMMDVAEATSMVHSCHLCSMIDQCWVVQYRFNHLQPGAKFCSVLQPSSIQGLVGHTMNLLSPFICVLWKIKKYYPLPFWLTLPWWVLSTSWCCPSRLCVIFLACMHLAMFLALSLSPGKLPCSQSQEWHGRPDQQFQSLGNRATLATMAAWLWSTQNDLICTQMCFHIKIKATIYYTNGNTQSKWKLNHWISLHCGLYITLQNTSHLIDSQQP